MTQGSRDTRVVETLSTGCGPTSTITNGATVTWSGGDTPPLSIPRVPRKWVVDRKVFHLPKGKRKHIGRALRLDRLEDEPLKGDIFSRTLKARESGNAVAGSAVGANNFSKNWITKQQQLLTWVNVPSVGTRTGTPDSCYAFGGGRNPPVFSPDDQYALIAKLRTQIMGSDFNLGSTLGAEGVDTVRYLGDVAQRIYRSAIQVKKLNFPGAFDVLREWGRGYNTRTVNGAFAVRQEDIYRELLRSGLGPRKDNGLVDWRDLPRMYLEYQLAVAPLLGDVVAGAQQLAWITNAPRVQRITAQVKKRATVPNPNTGSQWDAQTELRRRVIAYFTHAPKPFDFSGFQDPEVILWNALPLSFVADYAYNIGGFLEARGSANAFPPGLYVTTSKAELTASAVYGNKSNATTWQTRVTSGSAQTLLWGSIGRSITTALAVPPPVFKPFGAFEPWRKALTTFSLIALIGDRLPSRFHRE